MTIWRMRIACWIIKATNTYSEYVILIAFPLQQWLHARALILRYTYIDCLVQFTACNTKHKPPSRIVACLLRTQYCPMVISPISHPINTMARAEQFTVGGKRHIHNISRIETTLSRVSQASSSPPDAKLSGSCLSVCLKRTYVAVLTKNK